MPQLQAIVFDYDGVLADTEPLHLRAFQEALASSGEELTHGEYFERYLGLDDEGVFRAIANERRLAWDERRILDLVADKAARFGAIASRYPVLYPGVADRLRSWAPVLPLAIASGSLREEIDIVLDAHGLGTLFRVIVAAGDTPRGKPSPDPYLLTLERLGATPGACVAVEDSTWGIDAAHAAGMKVIALTTSYPPERLAAADLVLTLFEDLSLEVMEEVLRR